jgi:hypothetical protein
MTEVQMQHHFGCRSSAMINRYTRCNTNLKAVATSSLDLEGRQEQNPEPHPQQQPRPHPQTPPQTQPQHLHQHEEDKYASSARIYRDKPQLQKSERVGDQENDHDQPLYEDKEKEVKRDR